MKKNNDAITYNPINNVFSLFDDQFSINSFGAALQRAEYSSVDTLDTIRDIIREKYGEQENKESKYVLQISDEVKKALNNGSVEFVPSKDGGFYAQLRDANSKRISDNIKIKEEIVQIGITPEAMLLALQMEAIKKQLNEIIEGLKQIEDRIINVEKGLRNDRIGLFYSGLSLYFEAKNVLDESFRKQLIVQALQSINDANSQMIQDIRTSVEYLITEQYKQTKHPKKTIDEHLSNINQCYDVVYRASFLKAMIYQETGEIAAMLTAIDEYGRFVEKMIVPYVGKLSELDSNSQFIQEGSWGTIANTLEGCRELVHQISSNKVYLLEMKGASNEEG